MAGAGDFYAELGVDKGVSSDGIKKAFRKLARTCHPDVAKDDPEAANKFARIREAYETLVDPARRARYDRRSERRHGPRGGEWRPPGGWGGFSARSRARQGAKARAQPDIGLEDIFTDFSETADFGFGGKKSGPEDSGRRPPDKGQTIEVTVNAPARVARLGGTVTVRYPRMRRSSDGVNVYRYNEIHDLRIPPRTCTGDVLKVERMGDAGGVSGRYGDLICKINVEHEAPRARKVNAQAVQPGEAAPASGTRPEDDVSEKREGAPASAPDLQASGETRVLSISLSEAVLGGRVEVPTPKGKVHLSVPPGSSSGTRLRLKGRGMRGGDIYVVLRIVVPGSLDEESRALIERFAELNPVDPREDD